MFRYIVQCKAACRSQCDDDVRSMPIMNEWMNEVYHFNFAMLSTQKSIQIQYKKKPICVWSDGLYPGDLEQSKSTIKI